MKIKDKRDRLEDRRHDIDTPKIPVKDNYGVTMIDDRRNTPDRRIDNIQGEWIDELEIR
jgi:hypothetical protein